MPDSAESTDDRTGPDAAHRRPGGLDDATVEALGKLSEALETVEEARGLLYGFHRRTGAADLALGEAVEQLRAAGHTDIADGIERDVIGRNVISGRWTFQIVEDYDDGYYAALRSAEKDARDALAAGKRHLFEAELKEDRRTRGRRHHEALPADVGESPEAPSAGE
ncbi:MAG: hypothetical protein HY996_04790 [Micrococcales bacterium]|nr:hypothetical protein [Micrococcales bacterium]